MKLSVFSAAVFLAVVVCVHCRSQRDRADEGWSKVEEGACIRLHKYKQVTSKSLNVCKRICDQDTHCKSISYKPAGVRNKPEKCLFSGFGSDTAFYMSTCYLSGMSYTEKLNDVACDQTWSEVRDACIDDRKNYIETLSNQPSVDSCKSACEENRNHTLCLSISYDSSACTCGLSSCGDQGARYRSPCEQGGIVQVGYQYKQLEFDCRTCPDGFVAVGSQCFMYVQERKSWDDARLYCQGLSAELPQPRNFEAFQTFIKGYQSPSMYYSWLGARKEGGMFKWFNGTDAPVNGNHDIGDCVLYDGSHAGWAHIDGFTEEPAVLGWECKTSDFWFACEAYIM